MGYAKIDHKILTDPKTEDLSGHAFALFVKLIVWASREESDGVVPSKVVRKLGPPRSKVELISVGLCSEVDQILTITSYLKYQSSTKAIEAKRAEAKERKAKFLAKKAEEEQRSLVQSTERQRTENKDLKSYTPKPPRAKSGKTVCPEDFNPRPQDAEKARAAGVNVETLVAEMVDWSASDKTKNRKTDWHAVFRQWARKRVAEHKQRIQLEDRKDARYGVKAETEHDRQYSEKQRQQLEFRRAQEEKLKQYEREYREN